MSHSVIFCGTPEFAVPSLQALVQNEDFDVTLVISQPDRPVGRKLELTPPAVKIAAEQLGLRVFQPENINAELPALLKKEPNLIPDFLIVVAYGALLTEETLAIPHIMPINVHGSILPRWRGASPVESAILAGDTETGVTVQRMVRELDAGPILSTASTPITDTTTSVELRDTLCRLGANLLVETLSNPLTPIEQPEEGVTFCKKLTKEDGKADPTTMTAVHIDRMVRALNPWPGVIVDDYKIIESSLEETSQSVPLECAEETTLHLITVQPTGKKPMSAADWKRGIRG